MPSSVAEPIERSRSWPLTQEAMDRLSDEIARLRDDLSDLTGQGMEEGILRLPIALGARRLTTLQEVLDRCELVDDESCAAIGRRAILRDADGEASAYEIVFPGDGDPDKGCISADSPLGIAILGSRAGDVVSVGAPGGPWSVTVVSVD